MEQSEALRRYLDLERQLLAWRQEHPADSHTEDHILDQLDDAWWRLTEDEMNWVNRRNEGTDKKA
jgi:hypothetical protein